MSPHAQSAAFPEKQLDLLGNLSRMLEDAADVDHMLHQTLKMLSEDLGMMRGAITLVSPQSGEIRIEVSYGLDEEQRKRGSYAPGEGITGKVIASGEPMCVADVSKEPLFLNRTGSRDLSRDRISFICAPIKLNGETVGAISVDRLSPDPETAAELRLLRIIAAMIAHASCERQDLMSNDDAARPKGFVGNSEIMRQIYSQIAVVAPSMTTVFLQGESGTGKELAAKAIHAASLRPNGPFVSLNCATLPENLIESELFGHEKGAFTGAVQTRKGRFELASGGTIFLDEIGELTPLTQAKFLRILQERTFERLGGMETFHADVRVITATNRDLAQMVKEGTFRRDLFYRLNVFPICMPPLKDREEDILPLAITFLKRFARQNNKKPPRISLAALDILQKYSWPGNIRELQNVMERALLFLGHETMLLPRHLPTALQAVQAGRKPAKTGANADNNLKEHIEELESASITDAMTICNGHINKAAAMLGITERILGLRLKKYGIDYKSFRKKGSSAHQESQ